MHFKEWLAKTETFRYGAIMDPEGPEITADNRGAMPFYSKEEMPPQKCHCKQRKTQKKN